MILALSLPDPREREAVDLPAAVAAGLAAGAAYAAVLEADLRLTGNLADDLLILGRPFSKNPKRARLAGLAIHAGNSVALALIYALLERRLPGPPWVRGVIFANAENLLLYPMTLFERFHPAVRDGQVARYLTWLSFWQSVPRHVVYGIVLGEGYDRLCGWLSDERGASCESVVGLKGYVAWRCRSSPISRLVVGKTRHD